LSGSFFDKMTLAGNRVLLSIEEEISYAVGEARKNSG
jgi:hypothetical protein